MKSRLLFSMLVLWLSMPGFSQLYIGAELRPRALFNSGYVSPLPADLAPRMYVTQRSRLNADFKSGIFESYISFQDVRFWGGDKQFKASGSYGNTGSMSLHQGWFLVKPVSWLSLKVGRQLLSYDDQRILASRGWNDSQVTYDAVLASAESGKNRVDLGLSWNAESKNMAWVDPQKFRTFDFLRYQRKMEALSWSAIALLTGNYRDDSTELVRYRATWGSNLEWKLPGLEGRGSFYYQHHLNQVGGQVSAFCGSLIFGVPVIRERMKLSAGLDYVSGQDGLSTESGYLETNHAFDLLYGRRHGWYGYMDYFSNMPAQGLQDYMLKAQYKLSGQVLLKGDYHYFRLAAAMFDPRTPGQVANPHLGHELDLTLVWTISKEAVLQAGYSFLVPGKTLELMKQVEGISTRFPQFSYVMLTLKPGFTLP
jgi:Alginate export